MRNSPYRRRKRSRARLRPFLVCALLVGLAFGGALAVGNRARAGQEARLQQVVVTAGDTLWDVASRVASPSTDIRRLVWEIRRINGMTTAYLYPGQVLFVPER